MSLRDWILEQARIEDVRHPMHERRNQDWHAGYEAGYKDGESSGYADWYLAITEWTSLEDIDGPMAAAKYIASLEKRLNDLAEGKK